VNQRFKYKKKHNQRKYYGLDIKYPTESQELSSVVEYLPSKWEALSSILNIAQKKELVCQRLSADGLLGSDWIPKALM
jgi:hypothetical protein